jgi:formylglycine-generating enzyme
MNPGSSTGMVVVALGACAVLTCRCSTSSEAPRPDQSPQPTAAKLAKLESGPEAPTSTASPQARPASSAEPTDPPSAAAGGCGSKMVAVSTAGMPRSGAQPQGGAASLCVDRNEVVTVDYAACVQRAKCTEPEAYQASFEEDLYRAFCNWRHPEGHEQHPVNCLTFEQARAYCAERGARLLTDVEWKWVSSNGGRTRYPWGNAAPDGTRVNGCGTECPPAIKAATGNPEMRAAYRQNDGYVATAPVGSFSAGDTTSGIHDLAGNVSEFVVAVESRESSGDLTAGGNCFSQGSKEMSASTFTRTAWSAAASSSLGFRCASE